jgi:hypothetical protein
MLRELKIIEYLCPRKVSLNWRNILIKSNVVIAARFSDDWGINSTACRLRSIR